MTSSASGAAALIVLRSRWSRARNLGSTAAKYSSTVFGVRADGGVIALERRRGALSVRPLGDRPALLHRYDDFSPGVKRSDVPHRLGALAQRVGPVDDGLDLPGLQVFLQGVQVFLLPVGNERAQTVANERGQQAVLEKRKDRVLSPAGLTRLDEGSPLLQRTLALGEGVVPGHVEYQVVPPPGLGEVLAGVIDDPVRADRADEVQVLRAGHARDVRSQHLGDLHGERPDTPRRPVDQDLLSTLEPSHIPETLQRGVRRNRDRGGLLECQVRGLSNESDVPNRDVLGQRVYARAEDLIPGPEFLHVRADRFDASREVPSEDAIL